ncbi:PRKC apoptosis WT1 regulator protein isoform X2 [Hyalella azteca]|uniref:PRKC apoptosis WT1 regulator protein isoform X2 n=1 Tax=Hyalella azteca TaxID=294128 RepID=A0A8B7MYM0_HYAAZ|nr:PRKC apoptosis WT1 regulator protein isoform X2 [Hyalella azteca]
MASSSVSQDDIELDQEMTTRRSRLRMARARNFNPTRTGGGGDDGDDADAESVVGAPWVTVGALQSGSRSTEQDISPKPLNRLKEKRARPGASAKTKAQPRDRRKLREKRRSCGVVHVPSTESTGGSSGEQATGGSPSVSPERRPPSGGQITVGSSPPPQHPAWHGRVKSRNRSASDLEADDEDNEDYDSLTMSGIALPQLLPAATAPPPHHRSVQHASSRGELQRMQRNSASSLDVASELEATRQENKRLLLMLAERDQRIAQLQRLVASCSPHTVTCQPQPTTCPTQPATYPTHPASYPTHPASYLIQPATGQPHSSTSSDPASALNAAFESLMTE